MELEQLQQQLAVKSKKRRLVVVILFIACCVALITRLLWVEPQKVSLSQLRTAQVTHGEFTTMLLANGQFMPRQPTLIASLSDGVVEAIFVQPGQRVNAGEPLFKLLNDDLALAYEHDNANYQKAKLEYELSEAELALDSSKQQRQVTEAQGQLNILQARYKAQQTLAKSGVVSKLDLLTTEVELENAKQNFSLAEQTLATLEQVNKRKLLLGQATVAQAKKDAQFTQDRLDRLTIKATTTGQVQGIDIQLGQRIQAGALLTEIAQQDDLRFVARVAEREAQQINIGNNTRIRVNQQWLLGQVERISPTVVDGYVDVYVHLQEQNESLKPAQSAKIEITTAALADTSFVEVPRSVAANSEAIVWVLDPTNQQLIKQTVKFGALSGNKIQILAGLAEGQNIVLTPDPSWQTVVKLEP